MARRRRSTGFGRKGLRDRGGQRDLSGFGGSGSSSGKFGTQLVPSPDRDIIAGTTTNRELAERYGGGDNWYNRLFADTGNERMADSTSWANMGRDAWTKNIQTGGLNNENQAKMMKLVQGTYDQLDRQNAAPQAPPQGNAPPAAGAGKRPNQSEQGLRNQIGPKFEADKNPFAGYAKSMGVERGNAPPTMANGKGGQKEGNLSSRPAPKAPPNYGQGKQKGVSKGTGMTRAPIGNMNMKKAGGSNG